MNATIDSDPAGAQATTADRGMRTVPAITGRSAWTTAAKRAANTARPPAAVEEPLGLGPVVLVQPASEPAGPQFRT
jgi:hypothetical protein